MKFGLRTPSLKKRIAARTSWKRVVRHSLGLKAPRGWGWLTNPKKAAYNRIYNRTSFSVDRLFRTGRQGSVGGGLAILLLAPVALVVHLCSPKHDHSTAPGLAEHRTVTPSAVIPSSRPAGPNAQIGITCKLRSAASTSSDVIGKASAGESVEILGAERDWQHVRIAGRTGWVSRGCLAGASRPAGRPSSVRQKVAGEPQDEVEAARVVNQGSQWVDPFVE